MKLALVYNEGAGDGVARQRLMQMIEAHGHRIVALATPDDDLGAMRDASGLDAVVAAGGDGTIALVARTLGGSATPLAILPMGTANNIAGSLGLTGPLESLIVRWNAARPQPFDLGIATGTWGERRFVESLGGGLVTHGMVVMDRRPSAAGLRDFEISRALACYRDVLPLLEAHPWSLRVDDQPVEGSFLLVEVLNTPQIGPNLAFHQAVSVSDGQFSIVVAEERHRQALIDYVEARLEGHTPCLDLPVRHASTVEITAGDRVHLDDDVFGGPEGPGITIRMEAGALNVLR